MRKNIGRGSLAAAGIAVGAIALATLPGNAVASESSVPAASSSPSAYIAWLEAKSEPTASETAKQFKALSANKQEKFLDLINDVETTKAFLDNVGETQDTRTVRAGGAQVIVTESESSNPRARTGDMWAQYSVYDTIFGVRVTKVAVRTNYHVTGKDTDKVYAGSASHYNYVPVASFSQGVVEEWISAAPGDNAHSEVTWSAEWTGGLGSWSKRERVWGDYRGFVGGYLTDRG